MIALELEGSSPDLLKKIAEKYVNLELFVLWLA